MALKALNIANLKTHYKGLKVNIGRKPRLREQRNSLPLKMTGHCLFL